MIPNITRGSRMAGLVMYLAGPGRSNEHENPHVVAGAGEITFAVQPGKELSSDDALDIANALNRPQKLHGTRVTVPVKQWDAESGESTTVGRRDAHVWHCSLSLKADEGKLTDEQWRRVAEDFVKEMGFVVEDPAKSCRWVAIRHGVSGNGNDHIHLAVQLVREDGTKASVHNDQPRAQKACNVLEKKHGLTVLEGREKGTTLSGEKPAERERAKTENRPQSDRHELRRRMRSALATSSTEAEYVRHLLDAGVRVYPRFAKGSTERVAGYRVAMPPAPGGSGHSIWYSPSKLDSSLAWPRVQERFGGQGRDEAHQLLRSLHDRRTPQPKAGTKLPKFDPAQVHALMSGKVGPDTLANIYARVSMSVEAKKPGTFSHLSNEFARLGEGAGSAHAMRLMARAGSKDGGRGWVAVIQQANRLARRTATAGLGTDRPQWAATTMSALDQAERIVAAEAAKLKTAGPSRAAGLAGPSVKPARPSTTRGTPGRGRDSGHGR